MLALEPHLASHCTQGVSLVVIGDQNGVGDLLGNNFPLLVLDGEDDPAENGLALNSVKLVWADNALETILFVLVAAIAGNTHGSNNLHGSV